MGWSLICCFEENGASAIKQKKGWPLRRQPGFGKWKKKKSEKRKRTFIWQLDLHSFFNLHSSRPAQKQSKPHWKNNSSLNILLGISTGLFKPLLLLLFLHWRFNTVSLLWVIHVFYAARGDINQKHGMPSKVWGALLPTTAQGGYRWCDLISEGALSLAAWEKKKGMLKKKKVRGAVLNSG